MGYICTSNPVKDDYVASVALMEYPGTIALYWNFQGYNTQTFLSVKHHLHEIVRQNFTHVIGQNFYTIMHLENVLNIVHSFIIVAL